MNIGYTEFHLRRVPHGFICTTPYNDRVGWGGTADRAIEDWRKQTNAVAKWQGNTMKHNKPHKKAA